MQPIIAGKAFQQHRFFKGSIGDAQLAATGDPESDYIGGHEWILYGRNCDEHKSVMGWIGHKPHGRETITERPLPAPPTRQKK